MSVTVRLGDELEKKLESFSRRLLQSKSEIIKASLKAYLDIRSASETPYALGADLFGRVGSGRSSLSADRKALLKRKIREKNFG